MKRCPCLSRSVKGKITRERSAASTYKKDRVFIPSAQVLELNFLTVLPDRGHDVEGESEGAPSVLE
jgi:hypothetical protein